MYTIYFKFIAIINLYMFRAGLLLIIRRYYSVRVFTRLCYQVLAGVGLPHCAADLHQQGPDNICSHTTRLTTPMYFN